MPKWTREDNRILVDGVVWDTYTSIEQAQKAVVKLQTCEHKEFEAPTWYAPNEEIEILCKFCGAMTQFPIPSNLEWE